MLPPDSRWTLHFGLTTVIYGLASLPTLWRMASPAAQSDIYQHTQIAQNLIAGGQWISYSLFFPLSHMATLGGANEFTTRAGVTLLLAAFVALKAVGILLCATMLLRAWFPAWLVTAAVMLSMALPSSGVWQDIYLGQLNANVWHNSTTIVASAFVVPTFTAFLIFLQRPSQSAAMVGALSLALATSFKPSFALCFLPAAALIGSIALRQRHAPSRDWVILISMASPTFAILVGQFVVTFARPSNAFPLKTPVIAPLEVWQRYSTNIPASLIASLGCLLLVTIILLAHRIELLSLSLAWAGVAVAVLLYALVGERDIAGAPVLDGNWTWSAVPAVACAFFVACIGVCRLVLCPSTRTWGILGIVLVIPHFAAGLYYFVTVGSSLQPTFIMN